MIKNVLITGGTGFIGSHIIRDFADAGYTVVLLKRSFSDTWRLHDHWHRILSYDIDKSGLEIPFKENRIDVVIHTATNYGRGDVKASEIVSSNLLFPLHLVEHAAAHNVKVFVNTDSFYNQDNIAKAYLRNYSLTKHQTVEWLRLFANNLRIFNLKLQHVYGEMDASSKFIPSIIGRLLLNEKAIALTKGEQKRDFVYVLDVVRAYADVLARSMSFETGFYEYDIGTGEVLTLRELVTMIKRLTGNDRTMLGFGDLPYEKNEIMESKADLDRIHEDIGWKPSISIEDGLKKTIEWYREKSGLKSPGKGRK